MFKRKRPSVPAELGKKSSAPSAVLGEKSPNFPAVLGEKSSAPSAVARHPAVPGGKMWSSRTGRASTSAGAKASAALGGAKELTVAIGREAAANFRAWFERNFANPRAGRVGGMSYSRAGAMDDRRGDWTWYPSAYGRAFWDHTEPLTPGEEDYIRSHPLVMLQLALGVTDLRGLRCLRRGLTLRTNALQQKACRSRYYAGDNARRRALAAERRKIRRRTTTNPCPTPDGFRAAFARVKESAEAKVRFGGMVHDLACHVDSCLRYDDAGDIAGRNGGIRGWIAENAPELSPRYKTIMRYKALAMRARQLAGIKDPMPTSALLGQDEKEDAATGNEATAKAGNPSVSRSRGKESEAGGQRGTRKSEGEARVENYYAHDSHFTGKRDRTEREQGRLERERGRLERERGRLRRVLAECRNTFKDVFGRIDSELGQDEREFPRREPELG